MVKAKLEWTKLYCNIDTIGYIDHGKATLTAAATKVLHDKYPDLNELSPFDSIDKVPEERQRGTTISIARVEYQTEKRHYAHVGCPGHADHVKNMIAGAAQTDGAILVVVATSGLMAQTHRHILLACQVSAPVTTVVLNKHDTITEEDADLIGLIGMRLHEILSAQELDGDNLPIVHVVAFPTLSGDERWAGTILEFMGVIDEYIPQPERDTEKPFLMPAGSVFTITGRGTVITGHIERGIVKTGDTVDLVGIRSEKRTITVTGVEVLCKIFDEGRAGGDVGLLLRGTREEDVERGMVIIRPDSITPYTDFEATVYVLNKEEGGRYKLFFSNYSPQFYFHTTDVTGVVQLPEGKEMIMSGDNTDMAAYLNKPIATEESLKFVIREGDCTVGIGKATKIIK